MWALRRATNPLRNQCRRVVVARKCCAEVVSGRSEGGEHMIVGQIFAKPNSYECNGSARSFFWSRNLSSKAGRASSDTEDELEDGFSDLETPPETEKIVVDGNVSEEEPDEATDSEVGMLDVETVSSGKKRLAKSLDTLYLFNILKDAPRGSINTALDTWVKEGKPLGRREVSMVLISLRKRRFYGKALQLVEWIEANKHLDFEEQDYASYIDLIAKVHGVHKAEKFVDKIPESFRSEVVYRTLLANWVATANLKKSEEVFKKMRDLGFPVTTFACNQLLLLYKRTDRKKIADVLKLMEKENVKPSEFTYKLLIDAKGRANDISGMEDIVEMMKAEGMELDIGIHALLARFYIYGNLKERAEAELKEIEGDDITKNRFACKELLPLYASLGNIDHVERIWKVCEADPRPEECLAAIEAWGKVGQIDNAEKVFEHMAKAYNNMLSPRHYNALLKVYANHKLLSKGKDLAKRMSDNGCKIGPLTWDSLVKLYVAAGEVEKADSILQKATQQNQLKPLYTSFMAVLEKYAERRDIHNAEKLFHKMKQSGYTGRMRTYQILLQAYVNAKIPAYGFKERMKADNMFPSKAIATQLMAVDAFKKSEISELLD